MEIRNRTIIEKHGFNDPDRRRPSHDEIQLWVYKNFRMIIRQVFPSLSVGDDVSLDVKLEYALTNRTFIVGFVDVYCSRFGIAVEIKTELPTIGDLIRQIHFYSNYMNVPKWIVVSPDDRSSEILREHGVFFFKYRNSQLNLF